MDILILGAIVLGITQIVKVTFDLASKYVPATSLVISLVVVLLYSFTSSSVVFDWVLIQDAIIAGLTAGGLWSGSKATFTSPTE